MIKIVCKAMFSPKGKLICASQVKCVACQYNSKCEDIELFIEDKFEGAKSCMDHRTYKRVNKRTQQNSFD